MQIATLVFPRIKINNTIILGMKKRGFGKGIWNGFGGRVKAGESIEKAAIRELEEEANLKSSCLKRIADLFFYSERNGKTLLEWNVTAYFSWSHKGILKETEEMIPRGFPISRLPYSMMWPDDKIWLPLCLDGNYVRGSFHFSREVKPGNLLVRGNVFFSSK